MDIEKKITNAALAIVALLLLLICVRSITGAAGDGGGKAEKTADSTAVSHR